MTSSIFDGLSPADVARITAGYAEKGNDMIRKIAFAMGLGLLPAAVAAQDAATPAHQHLPIPAIRPAAASVTQLAAAIRAV